VVGRIAEIEEIVGPRRDEALKPDGHVGSEEAPVRGDEEIVPRAAARRRDQRPECLVEKRDESGRVKIENEAQGGRPPCRAGNTKGDGGYPQGENPIAGEKASRLGKAAPESESQYCEDAQSREIERFEQPRSHDPL